MKKLFEKKNSVTLLWRHGKTLAATVGRAGRRAASTTKSALSVVGVGDPKAGVVYTSFWRFWSGFSLILAMLGDLRAMWRGRSGLPAPACAQTPTLP